jgi:hypothetical protein
MKLWNVDLCGKQVYWYLWKDSKLSVTKQNRSQNVFISK